jgi:dihydrolipoamide dehydrogenase
MDKFDVVVIGGGPGGLDAGFRLVKAGKKVCIVQDKKERLGGVCLNAGCMPTKSFLKSASVYRYAKKASMFGLSASVEPVNLAKVKASVNEGIAKLRGGIAMMSENSGAHFIFGRGAFASVNEVIVTKDDGTTETVCGEKIIIATGSVSRELPFAPFDGKVVMNSDMMLENEKLPEKLLIIGGGAIGCEFATMYNTLGSKVKIVEAMSQLIPNDDADAAAMLKERFQAEGIDVAVDTMMESLNVSGGKAEVRFKGQSDSEVYDMVLISIGRRPNLDTLSLDKAGVETERGAVKVNEYLQSSNPNIYAAGDSIGGWMFAHSAAYEGEVCAANILDNGAMSLDERAVPRVVFSHPEMASVGIVKADEDIKVLHVPGLMKGRPITDKTPVGIFKLFVYKKSDVIAGGVILGDCATEIIHELVMAVQNRLTVKQVKETMHAHPTFAEPLSYLAMSGM